MKRQKEERGEGIQTEITQLGEVACLVIGECGCTGSPGHCDFLLCLSLSYVSPYVTGFTSGSSCTIIQMEVVLSNKKKSEFRV